MELPSVLGREGFGNQGWLCSWCKFMQKTLDIFTFSFLFPSCIGLFSEMNSDILRDKC